MEGNTCDNNHLDADVLLPPRKRLLAGLKRQNSDVNPQTPMNSCNVRSEFDARLNNLKKSHMSNPNLSNEEILEASRLAAVEAAKVAKTARALAEEKAAKAAKAVAAAKSALELVATVEDTENGERYLKKNKMKKHIQVQTLYNKPRGTQTWKTDEELARKLHRAINSSPRILKNISTSDIKGHKHKKLKRSSSFEKPAVNNGGTVLHVNQASTSNGNGVAGGMDLDGSVHENYMPRVDLNIPKLNKTDGQKMESREMLKHSLPDSLIKANGEPDTDQLKVVKVGENDDSGLGKRRGKIKQKKLPLSICSSRDLRNPKEDLITKCSYSTENNRDRVNSTSKSTFSVGPSSESVMPVERTSMWKCQTFKAPACVKQNKVMQS